MFGEKNTSVDMISWTDLSSVQWGENYFQVWNLTEIIYDSWKASSRSAAQEIPPLPWNPKIYNRIHKGLSLVHIIKQTNPPGIFISCYFNIKFNVIFPPASESAKWFLLITFSD
jgi:hypothetical protein